MRDQAAAFLIVIFLLPLFVVGALGGVGLAMLFMEDVSIPLASVLLLASLAICLCTQRAVLQKVGVKPLHDNFGSLATPLVWRIALFITPLAGAIPTALALYSH